MKALGETILYSSYTILDGEEPYTISVPFLCQRCGECCKFGYPSKVISTDILEYLGLRNNEEDWLKCFEKYVGIFKDGKLSIYKPCGFYRNGECMIHPVKPDECRYYPLLTDLGVERDAATGEPKCPGYIRHNMFIEELVRKRHRKWYGSPYLYPDDGLNLSCSPTKLQWDEVLRSIMYLNTSSKELELFSLLNDRPVLLVSAHA
jgi:Fe-S-cluster containining protein